MCLSPFWARDLWLHVCYLHPNVDNDTNNTAPQNNSDGPNNSGEFFYQDFAGQAGAQFHFEITLGALARLAGENEVTVSTYDAYIENFTQGFQWYDTQTTGASRGSRNRAYDIADGSDPNSFGKGSGFGDVELLCLAAPVEIGNRVWNDTDGDGVQDGGESGVEGVTMVLYDDTGESITTDTTDASGQYRFTLDPYLYPAGTVLYVGIDAAELDTNGNLDPDGAGGNAPIGPITLSNNGQGSNADLNDSDGAQNVLPGDATAWAVELTLGGPGHNNHTYDFGATGRALALGNYIWFDQDGDATQDGAEPDIANVVVELYGDSDDNGIPDSSTPLFTDTTDTDGLYTFTGLNPDTYVVVIGDENFNTGAPLETFLACANGGDPDSNPANSDSNGIPGTQTQGGVTGIFAGSVTLVLNDEPLGDGQNGAGGLDNNGNGTVDFCFYQSVSLGNYVWFDRDGNNAQDGSDPAIEGVAVSLYTDANDDGAPDSPTPVLTDSTDASGLYSFDTLVPGTYVVVVDNANFTAGGALETFDACLASGGDPDSNPSNTDNNGGGAIETQGGVTGIFADSVTLASLDEPLNDNQTGAGGLDTNGNGTVDFCFYETVSLGNYVWFDQDGDNTQEGSDPAIEGVEVSLYTDANDDGAPDSTTPVLTDSTDAGGLYSFDTLVPGTYVVVVDDANFTTGGALETFDACLASGGDPDSNPANTDNNGGGVIETQGGVSGIFADSITLTSRGEPQNDGQAGAGGLDTNGNGTVDFCFYEAVSLGNYIWQDQDADGTQDGGEPAIANVDVSLYTDANDDGIPDSTTPVLTDTTTGSGIYSFDILIPGTYVVVVDNANFQPGGPLNGSIVCTVTGGDPDSNPSNTDNNGGGAIETQGGVTGVFANSVTLISRNEPLNDAQSGAGGADSNGNGTVDFCFVQTPTAVVLGGMVVMPTEPAIAELFSLVALGLTGIGIAIRRRMKPAR